MEIHLLAAERWRLHVRACLGGCVAQEEVRDLNEQMELLKIKSTNVKLKTDK